MVRQHHLVVLILGLLFSQVAEMFMEVSTKPGLGTNRKFMAASKIQCAAGVLYLKDVEMVRAFIIISKVYGQEGQVELLEYNK